MKHIKKYKNINIEEPVYNDWVICAEVLNTDKDLDNFISNNIGKIVDIKYIYDINDDQYTIKYDDVPYTLEYRFTKLNTRLMYKNEIKYWSKNKEDLEIILQANKYNL